MKTAFSIPGFSDIAPTKIPHGGFTPSGPGPTTGTSVVSAIIFFLVLIAILFALWTLLLGGWEMITSRGLKEKVQKSRERVFQGIVGLVFLLLSFFIIQIISYFVTGSTSGLFPNF
jgi:hypothetical protein